MSAGTSDRLPLSTHHPGSLRIWFQAIRFFSFTASVIPILVASALAWYDRSFNAGLAIAMLLASVACHAGANLANDYYDHLRGIDTPESLGPSKVIQQGLLTPRQVRRGMLLAFAIATGVGLAIVAVSGWPVFWLAMGCLAAAVLYTGGPKPLGYMALGELTVFLTMGPAMVVGGVYVLTGNVTTAAIIASVPIGCLVAVILHANNIRDIELDRAARKVTLATLLGRKAADVEYILLVSGAYLGAGALVATDAGLWPVLSVVATLPRAVGLVQSLRAALDPPSLNRVLRQTAGLHLRFGALLATGVALAALIDRLTS
jgi:1,4-dihydroxy-2-naphthoate octaprenyltransferase